MSLTKNFTAPVFSATYFCSFVFPEALIMLQWVTMTSNCFAYLKVFFIPHDWRIMVFIVNKDCIATQNSSTSETYLVQSLKSLVPIARRVLRDEYQYKWCDVTSHASDVNDNVKASSSRPEVFCKKGVLRNFAKFTGKHLCWSLLLIKVQTSSLKYWKRDPGKGVFLCILQNF